MRDKLAVLNVTNWCNHACVYCSEAVEHDGSVVPLPQVAGLLDELLERRYTRVHFMGGETTLRRDLFELLDLALAKGLLVGIATNGVRFANRDFAQRVLGRLAFLELSLVTPIREDYRAVTGQDHQARVVQGLRNIMDLRGSMSVPSPLTINVVVCSLNRTAPLETVKLLAEMDLPKATFVLLVRARRKGRARRREELLLDERTTADSFRPALRLARDLGVPVMFRGLPTCALAEFVGHNNDAVDALLEPTIAYLNRQPIYAGIDIDAHRDGDSSVRRRMTECDGCPLAGACQGLDDDLPGESGPLCPWPELPTESQVRQALSEGPMGALLRHPADGSWPPPLD
jgi:MoaA/NifB/PqqE/SkfB family radical SAM enzyme